MTSWNPGDQPGGQGQPGQQPSYGQQPPAPPSYGQQPGYGQQPPAPNLDKGNPPPSYGQQAPSYGQQAPSYGQQAPAYGAAAGGYGAPATNQYGNNPYGSSQGNLPPGAVGPLSMGNRVIAYVIDGLILNVLALIAVIILFTGIIGSASTVNCNFDDAGNYNCDSGAGASAGIIITFVIFLILWVAVLVAWIYMLGVKGQTPGKKIMGVKVVDNDNGQPIGMGRAFLRYLVQGLANYVCFAGLWSAWLDSPPAGRYRGWHDKAVNSVVISVK
ncbi:RDD family protein [Jatrophihabitans sp. YIM 134969]